jgi:hypothetical protein
VRGPTAIEYVEVLWACSKGTLAPKAHNELTVRSKHRTRVDVCLDLTLILKGVGIAYLRKWRKWLKKLRYRDAPLLVR